MKWLVRGTLATTVIVTFVFLVGHAALPLGLTLLAVWFTVAWFGHELRPVTVDE